MDNTDIQNTKDNYCGIEDAALYLGISIPTLRSWLKKDNSLPAYRIGKLWKFKRSELDKWVESGRSAK